MTTSSAPLQLLRLSLIVVLLAGCSTAASQSSAPSGEPGSIAPSQPAASQSVGPSSPACEPGVICLGALGPGDYTSTGTGTLVSFTLTGSDWTADPDTDGVGFALYYEDPGGPVGITVAPWAGVVFSDPCGPEPTETIGTTPDDLIGVLTAFDDVVAQAPTDVTVGGLPAVRVDLSVGTPCADSGGKLWVFESTSGATFNLREGTQARFYVVDAGSVTVVIAAEALGDADFEALIQRVEGILATMLIAPAT